MVNGTKMESEIMHEALQPERLYVTVDILILSVREGKLTILLSRRNDPPYARRWALLGRFLGLDESMESAVRKLMDEMLPIADPFMEQLYTFADVNRDPRGRVISSAYLVILPWQRLNVELAKGNTPLRPYEVRMDRTGLILKGEDGEILRGSDLAFDHGRIIETGVTRLQGKIDYTDIGFRFLNDTEAFSLSELQTVFEAVLDRPLDISNFRRFILGRYEKNGRMVQTEQAEKKGRGRPAVLYRLKD